MLLICYRMHAITMSGIKDKVKEKVTGAKDKVTDAKDKVTGSSNENTSSSGQERQFEEGGAGTEAGRKDDPLTSYRDKEPMTPAKIKEHEPTAVKRDPSDQKIVEPGQQQITKEHQYLNIYSSFIIIFFIPIG
ncbi:MAG: hypothetical protein K0R16_2641 [Nitrososphaeraceae archaeon]|nr:hypothetical protein [Nitrososphaeraceae archaeon]